MFRSVAITLTLCLATVTAQAALLGRAALTPGGTDYQAYYDDVLDITWMADANLAATNTFGITEWHWLGQPSPPGVMHLDDAREWITRMNAANYLGMNKWRLPTTVDTGNPGCDFAYTGTDCGYNVDLSTGEMAHLFYSTLGNLAAYDTSGVLQPGSGMTNTGPFSNLSVYQVPFFTSLMRFDFVGGQQNFECAFTYEWACFNVPGKAWAVLSGDIATVPVPGAVYLFGSALGVMGWMRRKAAA